MLMLCCIDVTRTSHERQLKYYTLRSKVHRVFQLSCVTWAERWTVKAKDSSNGWLNLLNWVLNRDLVLNRNRYKDTRSFSSAAAYSISQLQCPSSIAIPQLWLSTAPTKLTRLRRVPRLGVMRSLLIAAIRPLVLRLCCSHFVNASCSSSESPGCCQCEL